MVTVLLTIQKSTQGIIHGVARLLPGRPVNAPTTFFEFNKSNSNSWFMCNGMYVQPEGPEGCTGVLSCGTYTPDDGATF
ncbi:hypothetical protein L1049_017285 [Liquidambar formosana]|uniref:Uncharacterized protein n=1 Tax=Liquidambar formosana TaxID=63359 RepID=A0AAP0X840_LIQFO